MNEVVKPRIGHHPMHNYYIGIFFCLQTIYWIASLITHANKFARGPIYARNDNK